MALRVQDPDSGKLFELPTSTLEPTGAANPTTQAAGAFDSDGDKILTLKDRPAGIEEGQWRAYLAHLASWAQLHPAALAAVSSLRDAEGPLVRVAADIRQRLEQAVTKDRLTAIAATLAADGITVTKTGTTDRTDGPIHRLARGGEPEAFLAFHDGVSSEHVVLRARLAMGVLPEPARTFWASLPPSEAAKVVRLFTRGTVRPEEVAYDSDTNRLYSQVNELAREGEALVVRFGEDRGDGPGVLRLTCVDGRLLAEATFEYNGSWSNKLELT